MATISWVTITAADLKDYMVAAQVSALQTAALGAGQADPFNTIMPDVVARVRAKIASCEGNILSATPNSVPPELRMFTCHLILEGMQARLPGLKLTDEQKTIIEDAKRQLDRIADCDDEVSTPTDPAEPAIQSGAPAEIVTKSTRQRKPSQLAGL